MAYNSSKGPQQHGDVKYEGDPVDTQIDFENDFIALKTNNSQRFIISGSFITSSAPLSCSVGITAGSFATAKTTINATHFSSSLAVSASAVYVNGTALAGGAITTYNNAADNRVITSVNSNTVQGEAGLTFSAAKLSVTGQVSASLGVTGSSLHTTATVINATHVSSSLHVSASKFFAGGLELLAPAVLSYNNAGSGRVITSTNSTTINGESGLIYAGAKLSAVGQVSASLGVTGSSLNTATTTINATHFSSSLNVSASNFYVKGVLVGAPAVASYTNSGDNRILTSVNAATINGEARLTFNDSTNFLFLSGNAQVRNHLPTIFFSNSAGSGLGMIGYNSANNIVLQNNFNNQHIVFKTNDNGTIKEGLRIDGAVPEVVVNQTSDSLVDFRVESDNNTHMLFVDGSADKIGINTNTPLHTLSVSGTMQVSGSFTAKTLDVTRSTYQYGGTAEHFIPFVGTPDATNADWENQMIAPFNGNLKRVLWRAANAQNGNITASFWRAVNTQAAIDDGVRVENVVAANSAVYTTTVINFTGSNHFAAGDVIGVAINPRLNPGQINVVCIWEFDKTTF